MSLDSYAPNRTRNEVSRDGVSWEQAGEAGVEWKLDAGWNTLRLRTVSKGGVIGPETAVVLFLEKEHGQ
jgi:hypothetical protein